MPGRLHPIRHVDRSVNITQTHGRMPAKTVDGVGVHPMELAPDRAGHPVSDLAEVDLAHSTLLISRCPKTMNTTPCFAIISLVSKGE